MKPVLIVEDNEIDVYALYYRENKVHSVAVVNDYGVITNYHDIKENTQYYTEKPLRLDFDECLKWRGRFEPIYETIDKVLEDKGQELQDLAIEFIESSIVQPFATEGLKQKYTLLQREQMGLIDAQEIVHGFMEDDVDLSGGEEDATK